MGERLLILDADGVFLDERPYWNAALAAALIETGRGLHSAGAWDALSRAAFDVVGLQRAAKRRGCNSNHDLAAVLTACLSTAETGAGFDRALAGGRAERAASILDDACAALGAGGAPAEGDPLARFGLSRRGEVFARVVDRFQSVVHGREPGLAWPFPREVLREGRARTVAVLDAARSAGWSLRVCTGRPRSEIDPPIRRLGLAAWLPPDSVTSADDVRCAEARRPGTSLGKPHPFPVWCAVAGFRAALDLLDGGRLRGLPRSVFVGDSPADAIACKRAREADVEIAYVHVRSPASDDDEMLRAIARDARPLGIVDGLPGVLPLVGAGLIA